MNRTIKVSTMLTEAEHRLMMNIIGERYRHGEHLTMSTLIRFLALHPKNPALSELDIEIHAQDAREQECFGTPW